MTRGERETNTNVTHRSVFTIFPNIVSKSYLVFWGGFFTNICPGLFHGKHKLHESDESPLKSKHTHAWGAKRRSVSVIKCKHIQNYFFHGISVTVSLTQGQDILQSGHCLCLQQTNTDKPSLLIHSHERIEISINNELFALPK